MFLEHLGILRLARSRRRVTTYMGCFGHDLEKCSHLLTNLQLLGWCCMDRYWKIMTFGFSLHGHPQFPVRFVDPVVRSMTSAIRLQIKAWKIVFHRFPVIFVPPNVSYCILWYLIVAFCSMISVGCCFRKDSSDDRCVAPSRRQALSWSQIQLYMYAYDHICIHIQS